MIESLILKNDKYIKIKHTSCFENQIIIIEQFVIIINEVKHNFLKVSWWSFIYISDNLSV